MDLEHKLRVLTRIAEKLNSTHVTYAVGASAMLYLRGLVDTYHDVDLTVAESDVERAIALLQTLGTMAPPDRNSGYLTRCFRTFAVEGVEVDLIAGMVIVSEDGEAHECPLLPGDIDAEADVCGIPVPLHSLACWRRYYGWMGRQAKAELVEKAMNEREQ